jgi:hypothetical protein
MSKGNRKRWGTLHEQMVSYIKARFTKPMEYRGYWYKTFGTSFGNCAVHTKEGKEFSGPMHAKEGRQL